MGSVVLLLRVCIADVACLEAFRTSPPSTAPRAAHPWAASPHSKPFVRHSQKADRFLARAALPMPTRRAETSEGCIAGHASLKVVRSFAPKCRRTIPGPSVFAWTLCAGSSRQLGVICAQSDGASIVPSVRVLGHRGTKIAGSRICLCSCLWRSARRLEQRRVIIGLVEANNEGEVL